MQNGCYLLIDHTRGSHAPPTPTVLWWGTLQPTLTGPPKASGSHFHESGSKLEVTCQLLLEAF